VTLRGVAERIRELAKAFGLTGVEAGRVENILKEFEADPEFKLPERIDGLVHSYEVFSAVENPTPATEQQVYAAVARRLREVREGKA